MVISCPAEEGREDVLSARTAQTKRPQSPNARVSGASEAFTASARHLFKKINEWSNLSLAERSASLRQAADSARLPQGVGQADSG